MSPLTLFLPTTEYMFPWDYDVLPWDPATGQCEAECGDVYDAAQAAYADKPFYCKLLTTCDIDDLRKEIILRAVDNQGIFTHDGYLTTEFKVDNLMEACAGAAADVSQCTGDRIEQAADGDKHWLQLVDAAAILLERVRAAEAQLDRDDADLLAFAATLRPTEERMRERWNLPPAERADLDTG